MYAWSSRAMGRWNHVCLSPCVLVSAGGRYVTPTSVNPWSKRQLATPEGRPTAYQPAESGRNAVAIFTGSQMLRGSSYRNTPPAVAAYTSPYGARSSRWTGGMSARHFLMIGPRPQFARPRRSTHRPRAGSKRNRPRSVPTQTPPESATSARIRLTQRAGSQGEGSGNSLQVRPPSAERASPRRCAAHRLPSGPAASARTYWLAIRPTTCEAVAAPDESVISAQVAPRSPDSLIPSAVAT